MQSSEERESYSEVGQDIWRDEVASRVNSYRARRRRKIEGDYSMKLDFESRPEVAVSDARSVAVERATSREVCDTNYYRRANAENLGAYSSAAATAVVVQAAPEPSVESPDPDFDFEQVREAATENRNKAAALEGFVAELTSTSATTLEAQVATQAASNVIVFPRPIMEPPIVPIARRDELAEPVFDRPRILDVPEDIVPTIDGPLFADIQLTETEQEAPESNPLPQIEVPLQVALVPQRAFASLVDWLVVLASSLLFMAFAWTSVSNMPHTKPFMLPLAMVPVGFWAVYQLMFTLYAGQTVGMQMARLRVSTFDGRTPNWGERKQRAILTVLSCASIGLGFLWAFIDEDSLCWHDRATKTFVTPE